MKVSLLSKSTPQLIGINAEHANRRIDNFLLTKIKGIPKSFLYRLLRKGQIRVNKKRVNPDYRLQENDVIRIPPLRKASEAKPFVPNKTLLEKLSKRIIYEDCDLIVINKPPGLAVHGGSGINVGVIELLRCLRSEEHYLELVHRLDRDTSGCLMIAKKLSVLQELHQMLREGAITKVYYALTLGHWPKNKSIIKASLKKNVLTSGERMVKVSEEGKAAITEFNVLQKFSSASLVEAILHTGRTHQIRVHAQITGHPIAGDTKYGDWEFNRIMHQKGLRRLFLHAFRLQFVLPSSGKNIFVEAPLDKELELCLERM